MRYRTSRSKPMIPWVVGLFAVTMLFVGCGEQAVSPAGQPVYTADNPPPIATTGSAGVMGTASTGGWYTLVEQTADNGVMTKIVGGRYQLTIDEGCLPQDQVTFTLSEYDPGVLDIMLEPHGIQFVYPVSLKIDYTNTNLDPDSPNYDGSSPELFYFNEHSQAWDVIRGKNDKRKKQYVVKLEHFSRYALGAKIPGDGTADW